MRTALDRWRYRYGRIVAALLVGLAGAMLASAVTGSRHERAVVVAARDLAAGHLVTTADLTEHRFPATAVVPDTLAFDDLVGKRTSVPVLRGEPFTPPRTVNNALTKEKALPPGHIALPVPVSGNTPAELLNTGTAVLAILPPPAAQTRHAIDLTHGSGTGAASVTANEGSAFANAAGPTEPQTVPAIVLVPPETAGTAAWDRIPPEQRSVVLAVPRGSVTAITQAARVDSLYLAVLP